MALVGFTCLALLLRCVDCNEHGDIVIKKLGLRFRRNLGERSLVTKEVKDHASLDHKLCQHKEKQSSGNEIEEKMRDDYSSDGDGGFQRCAICLEHFKVGEKVSWAKHLSSCQHSFHPDCIKPWISKHSGCPCCRSQIIDKHDLVVDVCCDRRGKKTARNELRNMIDEDRQKGEFCSVHGLVFPSPVENKRPPNIEEQRLDETAQFSVASMSDKKKILLMPRSRSPLLSAIVDTCSSNTRESLNTLGLDLELNMKVDDADTESVPGNEQNSTLDINEIPKRNDHIEKFKYDEEEEAPSSPPRTIKLGFYQGADEEELKQAESPRCVGDMI